MMIKSAPAASAHLADIPVPAPAPRIGIPFAVLALHRSRHADLSVMLSPNCRLGSQRYDPKYIVMLPLLRSRGARPCAARSAGERRTCASLASCLGRQAEELLTFADVEPRKHGTTLPDAEGSPRSNNKAPVLVQGEGFGRLSCCFPKGSGSYSCCKPK
jgi:hypothetical protein